MSLVCGVGVNDRTKPVRVNGKLLKEYMLWGDMVTRCYSEKMHQRRPTYRGCSVSDNFKYYSYFYDWCQNQVGFGKEGYQLDKDLLFKGNKVYSEFTCVFIPKCLNTLLTKSNVTRGELPLGVSLTRDTYRLKPYETYCRDGKGKRVHLGRYLTPEEAFRVYKEYKENVIKQLAEQYQDAIDLRAYNALMNYEVNIDD